MTAKTRLNVELNFLKDIYFEHEYFEFQDSNDIRVIYSNRDLDNWINANTLTIFVPGNYHVSEKLELPGLMIKDVEFDCAVPLTTQGTLMCNAYLTFEAQSRLMNGDFKIYFNDSVPVSINDLKELTIFIDPEGSLEFLF